jgi:hypothetical protein
MNEKVILLFVLLAISIVFLFSTVSITVFAAASNTTDIDVNISSISQITLYPNYLNWTQIIVGTAGGHKNITVKNTGSVNVTSIYGWVDTLEDETARPYGSSNPASYAAGGVLTLMNETLSKYFYLGRIEWNWTQDISSHDWSALTTSTPISWGYFRNMSNDYVWVLGNFTGGRCNETGAQFAIEDDIDLGTTSTRYPQNVYSLTTIAAAPNEWAYAQITSGTLADHCIAAFYNCQKVFIYKFDRRSNFTECGKYLYNDWLTPGGTIILRADAWVPRGIPAGNLTRATLTIEAT